MLSVIALGGNALQGRADDGVVQAVNLRPAVQMLAAIEPRRSVVVTHGNGPQVGLLALLAENSPDSHPAPLDLLGAETDGAIGYLIDRELHGRTERPVATLLTQVIVEPEDPAFDHPVKPIGPRYDESGAQKLAVERGWVMSPVDGGYRRVVPSPVPLEIVEISAIDALARLGTIVICCGGGGIPVSRDDDGRLDGVEAVVDKDLASALLAIQLGADELILLTDVDGVCSGWGTADERLIDRIDPAALRAMDLPPGSMGPKGEACARFVEEGGGRAAIGSLADGAAVLAGTSGTQIGSSPEFSP